MAGLSPVRHAIIGGFLGRRVLSADTPPLRQAYAQRMRAARTGGADAPYERMHRGTEALRRRQ